MRVAFFSPLPPSKSGIADYSAALVEPLRAQVEVEVFAEAGRPFDASRFDAALYQIGNNPYHSFVYETAVQHPGVVVMHEANLHHLIAEMTIRREDWDAYLGEAEYNGGERALEYARRVRALEVGPDYDGLPMLRRLLERSRAVIAHSRFVAGEVRKAGFAGPVAVIPHGAWIPTGDRMGFRQRLGLDEATPLVGVFGFLKPYKRIAESLRAFRRVVRLMPEAKMILVGEPHPAFPVQDLIRGLGLTANVRVIGFAPIEDFVGYIAACDVVLNLRYPTVGESSGSMLRAMGLGKAVMVSDVGAFREFPGDICLKVPVGTGEEDYIFEYLNTLISRPELARGMGRRAREWVERECAWEKVAARYASFLECVAAGGEWSEEAQDEEAVAPATQEESAAGIELEPPAEPKVDTPVPATEDDILGWVPPESPARGYAEWHLARLKRTLEITPQGTASDRVLEMGAYLQITPALGTSLGYGEVRGCYYGPRGKTDHRTAVSIDGTTSSRMREPFRSATISTRHGNASMMPG